MSNISVSSVHSPSAMDNLSIRGWGKKKKEVIKNVEDYAKLRKISFVQAYRELGSRGIK